MMTKDRIAAAIEALQPAPAGESMHQIARRARRVVYTLGGINLARAAIRLLGDRLHVLPSLDRQVLNAVEAEGCRLAQSNYHTCETAHCRAGWAITLHPLGRELEAEFGPWIAGAVIYLSSTGHVPDFFDMNEDRVLADIRACAAAEQS